MIYQIFYSGTVGRNFSTIPTAADAKWTTGLCAEHHVTGLTLYHDATFATVLEGEESATLAVVNAVKDEGRFTDTTVTIRKAQDKAEFRDYRAGFSGFDFSDEVPGAFRLTPETFLAALPQNPSKTLLIFWETFASVCQLQYARTA